LEKVTGGILKKVTGLTSPRKCRKLSKPHHITFQMPSLKLVHPSGESRQISDTAYLFNKCKLFKQNPALLSADYSIQSSVSLPAFRAFAAALEDEKISINSQNFTDLAQLCEEFGYEALGQRVTEFQQSPDLTISPQEVLNAIARIHRLEREVAANADRIARLERQREADADQIADLQAQCRGLQAQNKGLSAPFPGLQGGRKGFPNAADQTPRSRQNRTV
jgi:hypothetical protein